MNIPRSSMAPHGRETEQLIYESGVGDGWIAAAKELALTRTDIWLQTKFSGLNAHDPNNVPYDVKHTHTDAHTNERHTLNLLLYLS